MKWYSVKKYRPAVPNWHFVRSSGGGVHVCSTDLLENSDFTFTCLASDKDISDATHFALIDPIEVEE